MAFHLGRIPRSISALAPTGTYIKISLPRACLGVLSMAVTGESVEDVTMNAGNCAAAVTALAMLLPRRLRPAKEAAELATGDADCGCAAAVLLLRFAAMRRNDV